MYFIKMCMGLGLSLIKSQLTYIFLVFIKSLSWLVQPLKCSTNIYINSMNGKNFETIWDIFRKLLIFLKLFLIKTCYLVKMLDNLIQSSL